MPIVHEAGKDRIIMATEEELSEPSEVKLAEVEEPQQPGLILEDGSINWNCPCLGGMATGPCGVQFREAFSCFHYSTAEPKGSNCVEAFTKMQDCMQQYPALYGPSEDDEEEGKKEDPTDTKEEECDLDKGSETQPSAPSLESKQGPTLPAETAEKK